MRVIVAFALLLITGCACKPATRDIIVPCYAPNIAKPALAFDVLAPDASLMESVRALLIDREERAGYEIKLEAAIAACR